MAPGGHDGQRGRGRWGLAALGALLLLSLLGNVGALRYARQLYGELAATRLHPLGLAFVNTDDLGPPDPARPRVVLLGDSRVEEWPLPTDADAGRYEFVNLGLDTQTSAQVALRFERQVPPLAPRVVVLQVGINDLKAIGLYPELEEEIVGELLVNLRGLVDASRAAGARVVLTTLFPLGEPSLARRLVWSPAVDAAVDRVNAELLGWADARWTADEVLVLDTAEALGGPDGRLRPGLGRDLLHLRPESYTHLDARLLPALDELLHR